MTVPGPVGPTFQLQHGDAHAQVRALGAHLRTFQVGGRDVIMPAAADALPAASEGAVLAPWPNRLADGRYRWRGEQLQLPITEIDRMTALHGLVQFQQWSGHQSHPGSVQLHTQITPSPGYPFWVSLQVTYVLDDAGLAVQLQATNTGSRPAPYGTGFHPWLSPGPGGLDTAELSVDATTWYPTDERLLPTGLQPIPEHFDFRSPRQIGSTAFDDAFGSPVFDTDHQSWVRLRGDDGATAAAWLTAPLAVWQLCSSAPDAAGVRHGLAAEPMTCAADAFRTGQLLITLEPGHSHTVRWGMTLLAA